MLPHTRNGSARRVRILTFVSLSLVWGAGCGHPPQPLAPHRYVRVDTLLPLHPSWSQIRSFDQEVARLKSAPAQSGALDYHPFPSLPAFTPAETSPTNMAAERAHQIDLDAARYIDSLQRSLDEVSEAVLAQARRREQRRVATEVAARLAKAEQELRDENEVKSFANLQRIRTLTFRDLVVQSRVQDLAQAITRDTRPLREAQTEHAAIVAEIARLKAENRDFLTQNVAQIVARNRDSYYRQEEAKSLERLKKRADELKADKQEKIEAAKREQRDIVIPPPARPDLPPPDPGATPLPLPVETVPTPLSPRPSTVAAVSRQAALWQAQRTSLIAEIRADMQKAVEQVAEKRGWKLAPVGQPGALDGTDEAAADIREQWGLRKSR